jgi:hypothetical protein
MRDWSGIMLAERNRNLAREWASYIVGHDLEVAAFGEEHPVDAGVYFMFAPDAQLLYVGQSLGIAYRLSQHFWRGRKCAHFGAVAVPGDLMLPVETAYIHALTPPLNRLYKTPPYPDMHEKMVKAIQEAWEPTCIRPDTR